MYDDRIKLHKAFDPIMTSKIVRTRCDKESQTCMGGKIGYLAPKPHCKILYVSVRRGKYFGTQESESYKLMYIIQ